MGRRAYGSGWGDNYACLIVIDRLKKDAAKMQEQLIKLKAEQEQAARKANQLAGALNYIHALIEDLETADESRGNEDNS